MPAEWEPHAATWLVWPHFHGDWPGKFEPIPWVYAEIIRNLARHEPVELIVNDAASERQVRRILNRANALSNNVRFHRWRTDRVWLRDSGCIFVHTEGRDFTGSEETRERQQERGRAALQRRVRPPKSPGASAPEGCLHALHFRFNAWAKYSNYRHDEKIGALIADSAKVQSIPPTLAKNRVVLEGGSIDVNGQGTLLTTEECLLSKVQQRNPEMARKDYEKMFANYFGAPNVIWLGGGIQGDDTHGHVDDLARFVAPDTIVTMFEPNRKDPNHAPLRDNLRRLLAARGARGEPFNVVEIPMPRPVIFEKRRLPASYANFYIANGVVLAPVFNDANDRIALDTLARLFPSREIVPIYSGDLVWGFGAMHCMTQQQPAGPE
jgi:agmatine deiminase